MVLGSLGLSYVALTLDLKYASELAREYPNVFAVSADGAYSILSAIATSMVTVAGVTFSITMVALSLAANQYSPRMLRNYMRDRGNQVVLGTFLGAFAYALAVLRMIRSAQDDAFVPSISVLLGIGLAIASLAMFIFFVHHVAVSLSAAHVVSSAAHDTISSLEKVFESGQSRPPAENEHDSIKTGAGEWHEIPVLETGYLQTLDVSALENYAAARGCVIQMLRAVGAFVVESEPFMKISGNGRPDRQAVLALNKMAVIMRFRTIPQDPCFGIRQIVDVALKALSPGINDTTTALTCVDYLGAVLFPFAGRPDPECRHFKDGGLRLITREANFASLLEQAFDPIIPHAADNAEVLERMLGTLDRIFTRTAGPNRVPTIRSIVYRIRTAAEREIRLPEDRARILEKTAGTLQHWAAPDSEAA